MRISICRSFSIVLACIIESSVPAMAEGALVVGVPQDVVKGGFSYGWAVNKKSADEARSIAMEACRKNDGSPDSLPAKKLCKVVDDFRDKCVAIAMDPKAGTPGVGWAIASSKADADRQAVANCRVTAGSSRTEFCEVSDSHCDGDGK